MCTPLRLPFPRSGGAAFLVFWLNFDSGDRLFTDLAGRYGKLMAFLSGVICRISSVPTVFSFVKFSTCVTFRFGRVICIGSTVLRFSFVVAFFAEFSTLGFVVAVFATVEAVSSLGGLFFRFRGSNVNRV